ncbi:GNAT family N-acetyltransferase [Limnospira fusiformis]|uniref:GNAT family N-acetyltransferase n=1 Tax=Limnospira fusiformis TaxID=54297 RepID=UPI002AA1D214|nr:GNAT family N-acetyltransferase [Limnospira fusiformis LS22]
MNLINQKTIIRQLKGLEEGILNSFYIPIVKDEGSSIGRLVPINTELANDSLIIDNLRKWRQKYMKYFLTQFVATNERTQLWLNNSVLLDDTRILFLIQDEEDKWIGNFGICNIREKEAELDNLIRGEKGGDQKLIFYAEISLMRWIYKNLGIEDIYLHVFSNNSRTINLHSSVGFEISKIYQLVKTKTDQQIQYNVNVNQSFSEHEDELGLVKMIMDKKYFLQKHRQSE